MYLKALPEHVKEADKSTFKVESKYPPRIYDAAIDPAEKQKADNRNFEFSNIFGEATNKKHEHLNRMTTSQAYRYKQNRSSITFKGNKFSETD